MSRPRVICENAFTRRTVHMVGKDCLRALAILALNCDSQKKIDLELRNDRLNALEPN